MAQNPTPQQGQPYGEFTQDIQKIQTPQAGGMADVVNTLNTLSRRLRILEDRYSSLRRKTQITDQNMLSNSKRLTTEIRMITDDIKEAKKEIYSMKEKLSLFVKELDLCAKAEDVKVIDNYVNLWSPIKFVTQTEARNLIRQILKDVLPQSETFKNSPSQSETIKEVDEDSRP